ncbi:helix-turn-helix domain-containing protein [Candidatus Woesearchaeota archaeon]|nr:helix-turn-helix domain-containing protein [Candidatus Woesearchaeota archaeon]
MTLTAKQKYELKKFLAELDSHKAMHTELISVYIPQGYDMNKIINHLSQEQGTAANIKSASTRKNVISALERMIQHLRLFRQTPENGLAVFSGNVAKQGQIDLRVWSIDPPVPLQTRIYRCDKNFQLDILRDMLDVKEMYGLVVMDRREGNVAILKGKSIIPVAKYTSNVPGKTKAGGQCCVPDTLVVLDSGDIIQMADCEKPMALKAANFSRKSIEDSAVTNKWNTQKNAVFRITTKFPRLEIETSAEHVFFVLVDGEMVEKTADQLNPGDCLVMPEKMEAKGKLQKLETGRFYNSFILSEKGRAFLKSLRQKIKQKELAAEIGVTQTAISAYELGKRNIELPALTSLCKLFNLSIDEFIENYAEPFRHQGTEITLPTVLDRDLAQFLGYLTGDGTIEEDRITLFEQRAQVAIAYKEKFDEYFRLKSSYKFRPSKNYHQLRFTCRPLVRMIRSLFPEIMLSSDSAIPSKVLRSDDNTLAGYLKGLFDADGYISARGLGLGMNNKLIIRQVQLALLRFGIIASFHEYDNRRNPFSSSMRYSVQVSEAESLRIFRECVGFTSVEKQLILEEVISGRTEKSSVRQILTTGSEVREKIEGEGYGLKMFPKVSNFFRNKRAMSKQAFRSSILSLVPEGKLSKDLQKISDAALLPVKIHKIEIIAKPAQMVDISVINQTFFANGILVHNSSQRFERLREGAAKEFYTRLGEHIKDEFFGKPELKGIIVGGPGPTKYDFVEGNYIVTELKKRIIAIKDLSYTGDFGLQELVDKSQDVLAEEELVSEKKIMNRFFELLSTRQGMVSYGQADVMRLVKGGVVDVVLLSEALESEIIGEFEEEARKFGTRVEIISTETREGAQLRDFGMIAAILRYEVNS